MPTSTSILSSGGGGSSSDGVMSFVHCSDSKSLWNYTLAPGWTQKELEVLVASLKKYGIGRWARITKERVLPGKTQAQLVLQAQRLLGQQSMAEFQGLHLHLDKVRIATTLHLHSFLLNIYIIYILRIYMFILMIHEMIHAGVVHPPWKKTLTSPSFDGLSLSLFITNTHTRIKSYNSIILINRYSQRTQR